VNQDSNLPPQAEAFLARLAGLPDAAWEEIVSNASPREARGWLKGVWLSLRALFPPSLVQQHAAGLVYVPAADARLEQLFATRELPAAVRSRGQILARIALQALCSRDQLPARSLAAAYTHFDRYITAASLPGGKPLQLPNRGGA